MRARKEDVVKTLQGQGRLTVEVNGIRHAAYRQVLDMRSLAAKDRHHLIDLLEHGRFAGHAHEQFVLQPGRQQGMINRIPPVGDPVDRRRFRRRRRARSR